MVQGNSASRPIMRTAQPKWNQFSPISMLAAPQLRQAVTAQEKILSEVERFAQAWFERRHQANYTVLRAMQAMSNRESGDADAATRAVGQWFTDSIGRFSEDLRESYELSARCLEHVTRGGMDAGQEAVRMADSAGRESTRTAERFGREMSHAADEGSRRAREEAGQDQSRTARSSTSSGKKSG